MNYDQGIPALKDNRNFFIKMFQGDIPLVITYWIWGVFITGIGSRIIIIVLEQNYTSIAINENGSLLINTFYLLLTFISIFMLIAIWRSAGKYQGNTSWKVLARLGVIFNFFLIFTANFIQLTDADHALDQEILMMNKSLPVIIDTDTRLNHVSRTGDDIYYNYTLIKFALEKLDTERFINIMTPKLKTAGCTEPELKSLVNEGRNFIYIYRDKNDQLITKIIVTKLDCI